MLKFGPDTLDKEEFDFVAIPLFSTRRPARIMACRLTPSGSHEMQGQTGCQILIFVSGACQMSSGADRLCVDAGNTVLLNPNEDCLISNNDREEPLVFMWLLMKDDNVSASQLFS